MRRSLSSVLCARREKRLRPVRIINIIILLRKYIYIYIWKEKIEFKILTLFTQTIPAACGRPSLLFKVKNYLKDFADANDKPSVPFVLFVLAPSTYDML